MASSSSCSHELNLSTLSVDEGRHLIRTWRDDNVRRSEQCVEIWEHVLSRKPLTTLGDELWLVLEQVFVAALDCARLDVAQECINALHNKFPKSHRVLKLEAMRLECVGKFEDALKLYDSLIRKDDTNAVFRKRKVAVLKAQGKTADAIVELNAYLTLFLNDNEAWAELADLYLSISDFQRASFALEELILSNPHNHYFHQRYADVKYSQGGSDNVDLARSYYEQAVELNPDNNRALWGIVLCSSQLLPRLTGAKRKDLQRIALWASSRLQDKYMAEAVNSGDGADVELKCAESVLKSVQLNAATSSP